MVKAVKRSNILTTDEIAKRPRILPEVKMSDAVTTKNEKWINRERVLYIKSRGLSHKGKELMKNLIRLSPHCKTESTLDVKSKLSAISEIAEIRNCSKIVHFEARKNTDLYMWMSNTDGGPSVKFYIKNFDICEKYKFTGNCLHRSRPLLSFSADFEKRTEFKFIKEMFVSVFGIPNMHPKMQPFIDRIYSFSIVKGNIVFRHYQIVDHKTQELIEIGPRMLMEPIKIFEGSMGGETLYANEYYVTPNQIRAENKKQEILAKAATQLSRPKEKVHKKAQPGTYAVDETDDIFD